MFGFRDITLDVMAGLDPAIHVFACSTKDVSARHRAGRDDAEVVHQRDGDRL
jgi:hypothetical protein